MKRFLMVCFVVYSFWVFSCKQQTTEGSFDLPTLTLLSMQIHNFDVKNNAVEVNEEKVKTEDILALFSYGDVKEEIKVNIEGGEAVLEDGKAKEVNLTVPEAKNKHSSWSGVVTISLKKSILPQIILKTTKKKGEYLGLNIKSDGDVQVEGASYDSPGYYKVEEQTIVVKGFIKNIDCSKNDLTFLDVSKASYLEQLLCDDNALENIVLGYNSKISLLYCGSNKLKNLDLKRLPRLLDFSCWGNEFSSLELEKTPLLTSLVCRDNKIEGVLNLENNVHIEQLNCYNNLITSIKLHPQNHIRHIECLRNNINGEEMTSFLTSLPEFEAYSSDEWDDYMGMNPQGLYLIEPLDLEKNVALKSDVEIAKGKNWKVFTIKIDDMGVTAPTQYEGK